MDQAPELLAQSPRPFLYVRIDVGLAELSKDDSPKAEPSLPFADLMPVAEAPTNPEVLTKVERLIRLANPKIAEYAEGLDDAELDELIDAAHIYGHNWFGVSQRETKRPVAGRQRPARALAEPSSFPSFSSQRESAGINRRPRRSLCDGSWEP